MRQRPKSEQVFYDTMKRCIENQLVHDPNFKASGKWGEGSWYERNNKMQYELFLSKAEYILEQMESMKHLIIDEDETE